MVVVYRDVEMRKKQNEEKTMKKLVIIPAFNEEGNLEKTIKDIKENAPEFDYVIINDCSTDKTLEMCRKHG